MFRKSLSLGVLVAMLAVSANAAGTAVAVREGRGEVSKTNIESAIERSAREAGVAPETARAKAIDLLKGRAGDALADKYAKQGEAALTVAERAKIEKIVTSGSFGTELATKLFEVAAKAANDDKALAAKAATGDEAATKVVLARELKEVRAAEKASQAANSDVEATLGKSVVTHLSAIAKVEGSAKADAIATKLVAMVKAGERSANDAEALVANIAKIDQVMPVLGEEPGECVAMGEPAGSRWAAIIAGGAAANTDVEIVRGMERVYDSFGLPRAPTTDDARTGFCQVSEHCLGNRVAEIACGVRR